MSAARAFNIKRWQPSAKLACGHEGAEAYHVPCILRGLVSQPMAATGCRLACSRTGARDAGLCTWFSSCGG